MGPGDLLGVGLPEGGELIGFLGVRVDDTIPTKNGRELMEK